MLKPCRSYEEACRTFRWRIPETYNLAFDVCDRQTMGGADGHRTALIVEAEDGEVERYTFHVLRLLSNRLANVLAARGVRPGDRVAVSFGPSVEAAVTALAVTKMGAVAVPIPNALGSEPIAWRLADSGAVAAVVDPEVARRVLAVAGAVPALSIVLTTGDAMAGTTDLWVAMETAADSFAPQVTSATDPAFVFYPVHAKGKPTGVVHAHRALPGNLPAVEFALDFFPHFGDIAWGAGEWMSLEGLLWSVLPAWHHGVPVVARKGPFDAGQALGLMARHGIRVAVLSPGEAAGLAHAAASSPHPLPRALAVHGTLDAGLRRAVVAAFGVQPNDLWGTWETGAMVANDGALMEIRSGSPGRAVPGVTVEAVDEQGRVLRAGERGMLAVAPGAPGGFLGYHGEAGTSCMRLPTGWLMTGRIGSRDLDGYLWPELPPLEEGCVMIDGKPVKLAEVDAALALHPGVASAAVVAVDGQLKAFVVRGDDPRDELGFARDLQVWIAARRALHEVPRRVEFVDALPLGPDGAADRGRLATLPPRLGGVTADDRMLP